jgi:MFS-type transporter involved in bile tolerance (Atg22 family)
MSARRRRAALSALGALLAALFCASLASSVDSGGRRAVLFALTVAWLIVTAFCVANFVRTQAAPPTDPAVAQPSPPDVAPDDPA